jgi:hypothetical protein
MARIIDDRFMYAWRTALVLCCLCLYIYIFICLCISIQPALHMASSICVAIYIYIYICALYACYMWCNIHIVFAYFAYMIHGICVFIFILHGNYGTYIDVLCSAHVLAVFICDVCALFMCIYMRTLRFFYTYMFRYLVLYTCSYADIQTLAWHICLINFAYECCT